MTKFRIMATAVALVATAALVAGSALAGNAAGSKTAALNASLPAKKKPPVKKKKPVPFSASYSGKVVVRVSGSNADISADATGTGTHVGNSKLSGKGTGNNVEPCPLFGGPGTITAADGSKLNFVITPTGGSACTDEEGQTFALLGRATFSGGTGKYAKAKGSFKFTGTFDRKSGLFSVKFIGTLTI